MTTVEDEDEYVLYVESKYMNDSLNESESIGVNLVGVILYLIATKTYAHCLQLHPYPLNCN